MKCPTWACALTLTALAVGLSGCQAMKAIDDTVARVDSTKEKAEALSGSLRKQAPAERDTVRFTNAQWVNTKPLVAKRGLPPARDCEVEYNEAHSLQQFAQWVSETCNLAVRITPDALDGGASYLKTGTSTKARGPAPLVTTPDSIADLFPGGAGARASVSSGAGAGRSVNALRYSGRLSGLLDSRTGSEGLSWKYDPASGGIKIFYLDTRQFPVYAFNNATTFKSDVTSGMSSTAGASSSGADRAAVIPGCPANQGVIRTPR